MGRLFGTDGIRGIAGVELTCELANQVGRALLSVLEADDARILIGMDTRESSEELCYAVADGICKMGGEAVIAGVCSTPAVAYLVRRHSFDAGVMISASHNPYKYNGIKIFGGDGFKLSDALEDKIESLMGGELAKKEGGSIKKLSSAIEEYLNYLKDSFGVSLSGLRIGIDCANGSAAVTAERLFSSLGADCIMLSDNPNGVNINENCGSTHLESLKKLVTENQLDVGIAFDGDADRCLAVDELGREIDGDYIMAILALWLKERGELNGNAVVGTVMSNLGFVKFCEQNGISFIATRVGDRYVLEHINENGYSFGGEQSGHLILRALATTGDGQLTALALLSRIKESGKSLSALAEIMRKYPQYMVNISANNDDKAVFKSDTVIAELVARAEERLNNIGRLVIRPSGTEPMIRIMAEGEEPNMIKELCDGLAEDISRRFCELKAAVR